MDAHDWSDDDDDDDDDASTLALPLTTKTDRLLQQLAPTEIVKGSTLKAVTWRRYRGHSVPLFKACATAKGWTVRLVVCGEIEGPLLVRYVGLDAGVSWEARVTDGKPSDAEGIDDEVVKTFLLYAARSGKLKSGDLKKTKQWVKTLVNAQLVALGCAALSKEHFSQWGALTVATRENSDRAGREGRAERKEIQKRADVKLAPETYVKMHAACFAAHALPAKTDHEVYAHAQLRFELALLHAIGARGELLRSADLDALWKRDYPDLMTWSEAPGGGLETGMSGINFKNMNGDKTTEVNSGQNFDFLPGKCPLRCAVGALGLTFLLRWGGDHPRESFPTVFDDRSFASTPILLDYERTQFGKPTDAALKKQTERFKLMMSCAGVERVTNDAITHWFRSAAQMSAQDAGVRQDDVDRAINGPKGKTKDVHYTADTPLPWQLQRAGHVHNTKNNSDVPLPQHLSVHKAASAELTALVDVLIPSLREREEDIERVEAWIKTEAAKITGANASTRRIDHEAKLRDEHMVRSAKWFCEMVRYTVEIALLCLAARPLVANGTAVRDDVGALWTWKSPLVKRIQVGGRPLEHMRAERPLRNVSAVT